MLFCCVTGRSPGGRPAQRGGTDDSLFKGGWGVRAACCSSGPVCRAEAEDLVTRVRARRQSGELIGRWRCVRGDSSARSYSSRRARISARRADQLRFSFVKPPTPPRGRANWRRSRSGQRGCAKRRSAVHRWLMVPRLARTLYARQCCGMENNSVGCRGKGKRPVQTPAFAASTVQPTTWKSTDAIRSAAPATKQGVHERARQTGHTSRAGRARRGRRNKPHEPLALRVVGPRALDELKRAGGPEVGADAKLRTRAQNSWYAKRHPRSETTRSATQEECTRRRGRLHLWRAAQGEDRTANGETNKEGLARRRERDP